jgi:hypothetical protein
MKTAMQELIETIDFKLQNHVDDKVLLVLSNLKIKALNSLEKEKEQIQKAFSDGQETPINHPTLPHYSNEEYYNDNYNKNK